MTGFTFEEIELIELLIHVLKISEHKGWNATHETKIGVYNTNWGSLKQDEGSKNLEKKTI